MVGVPRSRGCAACKKQKKKCVGTEPPCTRCKRLDIPCIGLGERTFKFQDENAKFALATTEQTALGLRTSLTRDTPQAWTSKGRGSPTIDAYARHIATANALSIAPNLSNGLDRLSSSFTYTISDPNADTNFGLIWSFGGFLVDVPRHLGVNTALDNAVDALVVAYKNLRISQRLDSNALCLRKYSTALQSLRTHMMDIQTACAPETLCAIMVVMIFETLIGIRDARSLKHCDAVAQLIRHRGSKPPTSELDRKILLTLRGPIVIQSFFMDESSFTDAQWKNIVNGFSQPEQNPQNGFFDALARTARLFQRTRAALSKKPKPESQIERLASEALELRRYINNLKSEKLGCLEEFESQLKEDRQSGQGRFLHCHFTREYGLVFMILVEANCILAALDESRREELKAENARICKEICAFVKVHADMHQPLGALTFRLMLQFGYVGASTPGEKAEIIGALLDLTSDFPVQDLFRWTSDLGQWVDYLSLEDPSQKPPPVEPVSSPVDDDILKIPWSGPLSVPLLGNLYQSRGGWFIPNHPRNLASRIIPQNIF